MRKFTSFLAAAGAMLLMGSVSQATVVFSDNFDGYANQAAFQASWTPVGAQPTATLSTAQSVSAPKSVNVSAGSTTAVAQRNEKSFTASPVLAVGDTLVWSFDFYDSDSSVSPYRQYANLQDGTAPGAANQLVSIGMNNNQTSPNSGGNYYMARILGYTVVAGADPDGGPAESVGGAGAYFKLNDFTAPHRTTGWHNLKVVISTDDGLSTDYAFYVDNVLSERVNNIGTAAQIRQYSNIRIGAGVSSTREAFFDNMSLEYTAGPEPAALALFGLVGLGLSRRRA
jgi:hypothetical protein